MTAGICFDPPPARPLWLVTLADLSLLLVGTLLLFQALGQDREKAVAGIRQAFAGETVPPPIPVAAAALDGFAPGSAALPHSSAALAGWTRDALRDPRVTVTVTGLVDGSAADVEPASGSAALLAADRARAVVAALIAAGVPPQRLQLATAARGGRAVTATLAFTGPR